MERRGVPDFFIDTILGLKQNPHHGETKCNKQDSLGGNSYKLHTTMNQQDGLPAWIFCTRYSDRPCSGPRSRRKTLAHKEVNDIKRERFSFSEEQTKVLESAFLISCYLSEDRRKELSKKLKLSETQIKVWFQNKRAKRKKQNATTNSLAKRLKAQGLYNHR